MIIGYALDGNVGGGKKVLPPPFRYDLTLNERPTETATIAMAAQTKVSTVSLNVIVNLDDCE